MSSSILPFTLGKAILGSSEVDLPVSAPKVSLHYGNLSSWSSLEKRNGGIYFVLSGKNTMTPYLHLNETDYTINSNYLPLSGGNVTGKICYSNNGTSLPSSGSDNEIFFLIGE